MIKGEVGFFKVLYVPNLFLDLKIPYIDKLDFRPEDQRQLLTFLSLLRNELVLVQTHTMVSPKHNSPPAAPPPEETSIGGPQAISQALAKATAAPMETSTPVEMSTLDQHQKATAEPNASTMPHLSNSVQPANIISERAPPSSHLGHAPHPGPPSSAIQPAKDQAPNLATDPPSDPSKTLLINLLLLNGARHPYKIDERYLHRRNVNVEGNDPLNMTIYTLKELIWRDWREEWEPRPTSPGMIRLIHAGHMPDDKMKLGGKIFLHPAGKVVEADNMRFRWTLRPWHNPSRRTHDCQTSRSRRRRRSG